MNVEITTISVDQREMKHGTSGQVRDLAESLVLAHIKSLIPKCEVKDNKLIVESMVKTLREVISVMYPYITIEIQNINRVEDPIFNFMKNNPYDEQR